MKVFYSPAYVGTGHAFDTTRKAAWVAESLRQQPIAGVELVEPTPLTPEHVGEVHTHAYIEALRTGLPLTLAESQSFTWDEHIWSMVAASNGGIVDAALAALSEGAAGSLSSGLHHARTDTGAAFCTMNGLVLAARAALAFGAGKVLILDLDAHGGGGTASLIAEDQRIWQLDVSVDTYDRYESSERVRHELVSDAGKYLERIARCLEHLGQHGPGFGLCIYNAGMDPFEGCGIGGRSGITVSMLSAREELVFTWCAMRGLPVAFALAGGYVSAGLDQAALVDLHRLTVSNAARVAQRSVA